MEGAGAMATGIMAHVLALTDSSIQVKTRASGIVWLAGSASCDVIIAVCMLYFVSRTVPACWQTDHRSNLNSSHEENGAWAAMRSSRASSA